MKVMQIVPKMNIGGVERGVLDLVSYFKDKGIVSIVVSGGGRLVDHLKKEGVIHYKLPVYKKSPLSLFFIFKLKKIIEKERVDIVHARSRVPAWISFFATRGGIAHFITTAHGVYKNRFFSEVMGWGKFVICPSKLVARHMKDIFCVPYEKIIVINRWVNLDKFKFFPYETRKKSTVIVSIGRLSPSKGYEYLIEGFKKVIRYNPYLTLKIVGGRDKSKLKYFNYLKSLVNRFSLNYNVQFVEFRRDIEDVLKEARILIAPSVIEESFGRVIIEAFASGVPVIATRAGGFKEIIEEGKDGILIEPKNSEAISDSILKVLGDFHLAENLVNNARQKVEKLYSMENCLNQTQGIYNLTLSSLKILVIKISSLGDVILSLPSLKELKERFKHSKLFLLTLKKYSSLFYDCPYVDKVITVGQDYKKPRNILKISEILRRESFDYIIDLQNNHTSHLICFLSFPRFSFGYSLRWGFLLTKRIKYNRLDSPLASQERILKLLGVSFSEKKLIFWPRKEEKSLLPDIDLLGINVSASKKWESKNWPVKNIVSLIEMIYKNLPSLKIILLGDQEAKERAVEIENRLSIAPLNFCGGVLLKDLPGVIKKLKAFITPDTATLHLALALGIPTIALFGSTDPFRHTVKSNNPYVLYKKLSCSFCYQPQCKRKERNTCMEEISLQQVFFKLKEILNQ